MKLRQTIALLLLLMALPAVAYDPIGYASRDYQYSSDMLNSFYNRFQYDLVDPVRKRVYQQQRNAVATTGRAKHEAPLARDSTYRPIARRAGAGQEKLVEAYPASAQPRVRAEFRKLLDGFRQLESRFELPANDVASAVAAFLAGSYMAYRNVDLPDEHFVPLVDQMREALLTDDRFMRTTHVQRQEMYEQLATLGMLMTTTHLLLKTQPNADIEARMRQTAKEYLESFLGADAGRVFISARGMTVK